jgi:hypothetical protein
MAAKRAETAIIARSGAGDADCWLLSWLLYNQSKPSYIFLVKWIDGILAGWLNATVQKKHNMASVYAWIGPFR